MSAPAMPKRAAANPAVARLATQDTPQASPRSLNDAVLGLLGMTWPGAPATPAQGDESTVNADRASPAPPTAGQDPRSRSRSLKREHGASPARYSSPPGDMPGPRPGAGKPEIRARRDAWPRDSAHSAGGEPPRRTAGASVTSGPHNEWDSADAVVRGSSPVEAMLLAAQRAAQGDGALDAAKTPAASCPRSERPRKSSTPRSRGHPRPRVRVRASRRTTTPTAGSGRARGGTPTHKSANGPRAGSASGSPPVAASPANGAQDSIIGRSRTHWLTNDDIYELLCNFEEHGLSVRERPVQNPPSGSLFVYNRLVTKHYRDDGVPLRKRPDRSNSAKECHMKLKLQDRYVMNAVYASCLPDDDGTCFSRRVYSRLDDASWPYVLVHYLQAGNTRVYAWNGSSKKRAVSRRGSRSRASGRTPKRARTRRRSPSSGSASSKKSEGASSLDDASTSTKARSSRPSRSPKSKSKRSRASALGAVVTTPAASPTSAGSNLRATEPQAAPPQMSAQDASAVGASEAVAQAGPAAMFGAQLGAPHPGQVAPLASMLSHHHLFLQHQLQQQLQAEKSLGLSQQLFQSMSQVPSLLRHVDIAPAVASTAGGCMVVTRLMGNSVLLDMLRLPGARLQCQFGMVIVPAVCSEPGVVQCVAPQHATGVVPFSVRLHGSNVSLAISFTFLPTSHLGSMNPLPGASMSFTPTTTATSMSVLTPNAQQMAQVHAQALARAHAQAQQHAAQASAAGSALRHQIILRHN